MTETETTAPKTTKKSTFFYVVAGINLVLIFFVGIIAIQTIFFGSTDGLPLTTLVPRGDGSEKIHTMAKALFAVAILVFFIVEIGVLAVVVKFRNTDEEGKETPDPKQIHGHFKAEITWTLVPLIILAGLAVLNLQTVFALQEKKPDALKVTVVGQQWWWEFRYDTDNDGTVDIITANQMVVPVGRQVQLEIQSNDVIHSFWIPALNGKKDAVPGRSNYWSIEAKETGLFEGQCTEFCGLSHGYMRMQVKAVSADEYEDWVTNQLKPPVEPKTDEQKAGQEAFQRCAACHQINGEDGPQAEYTPVVDGAEAEIPLLANNAPNLTHLMSRDTFAGSMFKLKNDDGSLNRAELEAWLRNPPAMKPAAADWQRGMPDLNLSEEEIDSIVAYLETLE